MIRTLIYGVGQPHEMEAIKKKVDKFNFTETKNSKDSKKAPWGKDNL